MCDCDGCCQFDAEDVAYAIIHVQHKDKPLSSPERLDCGYCNRDYWHDKDGEWRKAYDARKVEHLKADAALQALREFRRRAEQ